MGDEIVRDLEVERKVRAIGAVCQVAGALAILGGVRILIACLAYIVVGAGYFILIAGPGLASYFVGRGLFRHGNGARQALLVLSAGSALVFSLMAAHEIRDILAVRDAPQGNFPRSFIVIMTSLLAGWNVAVFLALRGRTARLFEPGYRDAVAKDPAKVAFASSPWFLAGAGVVVVTGALLWLGGFEFR